MNSPRTPGGPRHGRARSARKALRVAASIAAGLGLNISLPAADAPAPLSVRVVHPRRGEIVRYVALPGSVRANQQATLNAKVAGYLKSITVDKGDTVKAGQVLAEIEVPELLADRAKSIAEVKVAETECQRLETAQRKAPDLVMPQAVDEAKGRLEIARANLERITTLLSYSRLTAPFAGVVTMRHVDPGAFIPTAVSGGSAGTSAVVTLMEFDTVRVQVAVPELEASLVRPGQPVRLTVEGLRGRTFEASVSRMGYALDESTRTMLMEADLPNPQHELRPGMYATVRTGVERHTDALLVPVEALVTEKANAFLFVVDSQRAHKTGIKSGFNDGTDVEILSGLDSSSAVILPGKTALADGQAINATEVR